MAANVLAGESASLLAAIQQPFDVLSADSGPFLTAISQNPQEISQLLRDSTPGPTRGSRPRPRARIST